MNKQVNAIISLKDKFSAPLLRMSDNVKKLTKDTRDSMNQVNRWGKQVEKATNKAIKSAKKWAKRGAILLGGWSVKSGLGGLKELDSAARKVKSIAGDALNLDSIKNDLLSLSSKLGKSVESLGDAYYNAISASVPIDMALDAVELAHKVATAGFTTDDAAMNLLATTMNAFGYKNFEDMQRIADTVLLTQNKGIILADDMAKLFGRISPISSSLGVDLADQAAVLATLTKKGILPSEAVTGASRLMTRFLQKTGDDAQAMLKKIGLGEDFFSAKTIKKHGLIGVLEMLQDAIQGDMDIVGTLFPNIKSQLAEAAFGDKKTIDDVKQLQKLMQDPSGALDEAYEVMEGSIYRRLDRIKERIKNLNTKFYLNAEGNFVKVLDKIEKWLENNEDNIIKFVDNMTGKIADLAKEIWEFRGVFKFLLSILIIVRSIIKLISSAGKIFEGIKTIKKISKALKLGKIVSSFGAVAPKILAVAFAVYFAYKVIKRMIEKWDDLKERYPETAQRIEEFGKKVGVVWDVLKNTGKLLYQGIKWLLTDFIPTVFGGLIDFLSELLFKAIGGIIRFLNGLLSILAGVFKIIRGIFTGDFEEIKEGFSMIAGGIKDAFLGIVETLASPVEAIVGMNWDSFSEGFQNVWKKWESLKEFLNEDIEGKINISSKLQKRDFSDINKSDPRNRRKVGNNYTGTDYWRGGLTYLHERGGEIVDLDQGSRVYPHDRSVAMAYNDGLALGVSSSGMGGGQVFNFGDININAGKTDEKFDINRVGTQFIQIVKDNLKNI